MSLLQLTRTERHVAVTALESSVLSVVCDKMYCDSELWIVRFSMSEK